MAVRNRTSEFERLREKYNRNDMESDDFDKTNNSDEVLIKSGMSSSSNPTNLLEIPHIKSVKFAKYIKSSLKNNNKFGNFKNSNSNSNSDSNISQYINNENLSNSTKILELDSKLKSNCDKIQKEIIQLEKLHTQRLMVNFVDDEKAQEQNIEQYFLHIKELLDENNKFINTISLINIDERVKENFLMHHATQQKNLIAKLRQSQKSYLDKLTKQKYSHNEQKFFIPKNKNCKTNDVEISQNTNSNSNSNSNIITLALDEDYDDLVARRDVEIISIAKSVEELAIMFKDLNSLVVQQGTILDRIDYNMECAVSNVKSGNDNLETANKHHKKASSTQIKLIGGLIGIIGLLGGILALKQSNGL